MEVGCRVWWFTTSTMTLQHHRCSTVPRFPNKPSPPAQIVSRGFAHILNHSIKRCWNTLYIYNMEVGYRVRWFIGGFGPQPWPYRITGAQLFTQFPKKPPPSAQIISIRVSAYPQPQLRKLLKHFFYTYNMDVGCRVRWVIASTMTVQHHSYPTIPYHSYSSVPSIYQKASSCTDISVKGAPISSSTAYNAAETLTLHIYIIWKLDAVSGGL